MDVGKLIELLITHGGNPRALRVEPQLMGKAAAALAAERERADKAKAEARRIAAERNEYAKSKEFWLKEEGNRRAERDDLTRQMAEAVEVVKRMANAADDVGVMHFDTDTMSPIVAEMRAATDAARAFIQRMPS